MADYGKRALKKAQTKLDILQAMLELIVDTNFRDKKVRDIAEKVGITEMTFFNYFKTKDDLLNYYMKIWSLQQQALQLQSPLAGEAAIRRVFASTAQETLKYPRVLVNLISYLASLYQDPNEVDIEPAERFLLYPELEDLHNAPIASGNEILMGHLNEIDPDADNDQLLRHLASCFYGDALVAYTSGADLQVLYKASLDLIFRSKS